MKKLLITLSLFLALSISMIAQGVNISGTVTDGNGTGIANYPVYIESDSSTMFSYFNLVYTNANGNYSDLVPTTASQGALHVSSSDSCTGAYTTQTLNYNPVLMSFTNVDFSMCGVSPPACNTTFVTTVNDSIATFSVNVTGGTAPYTYAWDYGDGSVGTSVGTTNSHFYAANGLYLACVTVTDAGGCISIYCDSVNITSYNNTPCNIAITNLASTNPTSCNVADGTITIIATGTSLEYSIDGGINWQASNIFTGLSGGTYYVAVRNMNGTCFTPSMIPAVLSGGQSGQINITSSISGNTATFQSNVTGGTAPYTYFWNFGDSSTSTTANPSHTYAGSGFYQVCLTITDASGCTTMSCVSVVVGSSAPCAASYSYNVSSMGSIAFTNTSTSNGPGSLAYFWDFGDGMTSYSQNPVHTYNAPGTYMACLTISDSLSNCFDTYCDTLVIQGSGSSCSASFTYQTTPVGTQVWFAGMATGGTAPYTYAWDFGDNSTSTGANPTHTYTSAGAYTVTLTITDATGCTATYLNVVGVQGGGSQCSVSYTHTVAGSVASFVATATGNGPYTYFWDFGDNNSGNTATPTHTYASDGIYGACVTISDSFGCSNTYCDTVVINTGSGGTSNIGGIVLVDSALATSANVYLYQYDSILNNVVLLSQTTTVQGSFNFNLPNGGDFILRAALTSADPDFANYLPTYYMQSLAWNGATLVNLTPSTSAQIIIPLINGSNAGTAIGQNIAGGTVSLGTYTPPTGVIIWRTVVLMDAEKEAIAYTYTDANGDYKFENLADGVYYIYVEEPGLLSTPIQVTLNANATNLANVDFRLDQNYVVFTATDKITSVEKLNVFPNPVRDQLMVQLTLNQDVDMNVSILNVTGQVMLSEQHNLNSGENRVNVLMNDLPAGIYMLRLQSKEGVITQKIVKQ